MNEFFGPLAIRDTLVEKEKKKGFDGVVACKLQKEMDAKRV